MRLEVLEVREVAPVMYDQKGYRKMGQNSTRAAAPYNLPSIYSGGGPGQSESSSSHLFPPLPSSQAVSSNSRNNILPTPSAFLHPDSKTPSKSYAQMVKTPTKIHAQAVHPFSEIPPSVSSNLGLVPVVDPHEPSTASEASIFTPNSKMDRNIPLRSSSKPEARMVNHQNVHGQGHNQLAYEVYEITTITPKSNKVKNQSNVSGRSSRKKNRNKWDRENNALSSILTPRRLNGQFEQSAVQNGKAPSKKMSSRWDVPPKQALQNSVLHTENLQNSASHSDSISFVTSSLSSQSSQSLQSQTTFPSYSIKPINQRNLVKERSSRWDVPSKDGSATLNLSGQVSLAKVPTTQNSTADSSLNKDFKVHAPLIFEEGVKKPGKFLEACRKWRRGACLKEKCRYVHAEVIEEENACKLVRDAQVEINEWAKRTSLNDVKITFVGKCQVLIQGPKCREAAKGVRIVVQQIPGWKKWLQGARGWTYATEENGDEMFVKKEIVDQIKTAKNKVTNQSLFKYKDGTIHRERLRLTHGAYEDNVMSIRRFLEYLLWYMEERQDDGTGPGIGSETKDENDWQNGSDISKAYGEVRKIIMQLLRTSHGGPDAPCHWSAHAKENPYPWTVVTKTSQIELVVGLINIFDMMEKHSLFSMK